MMMLFEATTVMAALSKKSVGKQETSKLTAKYTKENN